MKNDRKGRIELFSSNKYHRYYFISKYSFIPLSEYSFVLRRTYKSGYQFTRFIVCTRWNFNHSWNIRVVIEYLLFVLIIGIIVN